MLRFWNFFLEKRQFSYMLVGSLIVAGCYALIALPKENTPSIDIPYGTVVTVFPGASAADTETLVTNKLEAQIGNIANVDKLVSSSGAGVSVITVQFDATADTNRSIQDLRDAAAKAVPDLPSDATTPVVSKVSFDDQPVLVISIAGNLAPAQFSQLGTELSNKLKTINGISRVTVTGVPEREVNVVVRKESLALYGLRITDVIQAIAASNAALPAGSITMDGVSYDVNFKGGLRSTEEIKDIAVSTKSGVPVYLRDIADINDGLASATSYSRVSVGGEPSKNAITLLVFRQSGAALTEVSADAKELIESLKPTTLEGLSILIDPSTDQGVQVGIQLGDLTKTGLETVLLVIAALLLTIGWRESLVAALSIPLSFLIAFIGLLITGNTLNFISLFALILAVGILVDSGIVMTEAIHARMRHHASPLDAAKAALSDYAWPLIGGTMATVAVFAPLFFISGIIGKFIAGIPYTLIFVLMASIFVALGIVPLIAILFTKGKANRLEIKQEEYTEKATHWYEHKLRALLENRRHQKIFMWSLAGFFVVALALPITGVVQSIFFPQEDVDFVYLDIKKPQGTTLDHTDLAARAVEEILYGNPSIASFTTTVGRSSDLSGSGGSASGNVANITINLPEKREKSSTEIQDELQHQLESIKDADVQVYQPNNGPPSGAPISIKFSGDSLEDLGLAADRAKQLLSSIPGATNITSSTQNNGTEFNLSIDRARAATFGLNTQLVAQTLRAAVNGTKATSIPAPDQDIDVIVKMNLNPAYTDPSKTNEVTIDAIKNLTVQGQSGPVLLGTVLSSNLAVSNSSIAHEDRDRVETVSAYPAAETTASEITSEFQRRISEIDLPQGVAVSYGGEDEDINTSFTQMFLALVAGLVLMFMILILSFNSFRYTFYLLSIVPLSLIGVFVGLALTGQPLSFPSMLGFIALGGVIINHAIILMDSMIHLRRSFPDKSPIDVVVESSALRLRPIFLTTVTTVIGMVPLARSSGMWGPLAFTIMFGLTFAIILTLVLLPVLFFRSEQRRLAREEKKAAAALSLQP